MHQLGGVSTRHGRMQRLDVARVQRPVRASRPLAAAQQRTLLVLGSIVGTAAQAQATSPRAAPGGSPAGALRGRSPWSVVCARTARELAVWERKQPDDARVENCHAHDGEAVEGNVLDEGKE